MILVQIKCILLADGFQVEVVSKPPQDQQDRPRYCAHSEVDVFWVMLGEFAYPTVGKGMFVLVGLGYPIDDEDGACDEVAGALEEYGGRK